MSWQQVRCALAGQADRFAADLAEAGAIQRGLLAGLVDRATGQPLADLHANRPIQSHEDQAAAIAEAAQSGKALVVGDDLLAFEETSGSTSAAKLIPITRNAIAAMQSAILPWLDDLLSHRPGITEGRAFLAISPATRAVRHTGSGHPIGLPDAAWFGADIARALLPCLAVSPAIASIRKPKDWQMAVLAALISAEDLRFVSLWSPSYLTGLLDALPAHLPALADTLPAHRQQALKQAVADDDFSRLWPHLADISCWTHGWAAQLVPALQARLPQARIQPKGLLATEAAISIPLEGLDDPVFAPRAARVDFYDANGAAHDCDDLIIGHRYRIVITTQAGLIRQDLGDMVRVTGTHGQSPLLRFEGRAGLVSDLCGEKLNEAFVLGICAAADIAPALLLPCPHPRPHYALCLDARSPDPASIAARLEQGLRGNPHYDHARRIGQLDPLRIYTIPQLERQYRSLLEADAPRSSVLKLPMLNLEPGLLNRFTEARPISAEACA